MKRLGITDFHNLLQVSFSFLILSFIYLSSFIFFYFLYFILFYSIYLRIPFIPTFFKSFIEKNFLYLQIKTIREKSKGAEVLLGDPCSFDGHLGNCTRASPNFSVLEFSRYMTSNLRKP